MAGWERVGVRGPGEAGILPALGSHRGMASCSFQLLTSLLTGGDPLHTAPLPTPAAQVA